jgi:hypothetical protein
VSTRPEHDLIAFAERLMSLLDQGQFVATYKYAVLLGLMDLCLEATDRHGQAPQSVTTRELAGKVIELYWPHTQNFDRGPAARVLRQNSGRQARILADIGTFREHLPDPSVTLDRARVGDSGGYRRLLNYVEWTLILMPLPRLQVVGRHADPFVYEIAWDLGIEKRHTDVRRYQRGEGGDFDNLIRFQPGVGDHLVRLNGLLRPLIYRGWASIVARFNGLPESELESFLFGIDRTALAAVRQPLTDLQHGQCFYCGTRLGPAAEVDHFIPWARRPDNGIHNLVVADRRCNGSKRDFLAAPAHVGSWMERNRGRAAELDMVASEIRWESHLERTLGAARGIYFRLGEGTRLWLAKDEFLKVEAGLVQMALA